MSVNVQQKTICVIPEEGVPNCPPVRDVRQLRDVEARDCIRLRDSREYGTVEVADADRTCRIPTKWKHLVPES
jgi:hypothetical protein